MLLPTKSPGQATWSVRIPKYEYYEHMYLGFAILGESGEVFSSASLMPWSTGGFPRRTATCHAQIEIKAWLDYCQECTGSTQSHQTKR